MSPAQLTKLAISEPPDGVIRPIGENAKVKHCMADKNRVERVYAETNGKLYRRLLRCGVWSKVESVCGTIQESK